MSESRMYSVLRAGCLLLAALVMSACAGIGARSDFDSQAGFDDLQSFAWQAPARSADDERPVWDNELLARRVAAAVREELLSRGYREAAPEEADFLVTYATGERERARGSSVTIGMGGGYRRSSLFFGQQFFADDREEGVLILDVISGSDQALIWRGWAARDVSGGSFPQEDVNRYVTGILKGFPPS